MGRVIVGVTAGTLFFVAASRTTSTGATTDVVTYHNDVARTGQNLNETSLTPTTVTAATFGKTRLLATDGKVDAQPLFLSGVLVPGVGVRDVVYVATEHDSVYAFDASSGSMLWQVSLLGTGETTSDTRGCSQVTPEIGITSTPVIDRSRGANGIVYVVAMSKTAAGAYVQRLHALDAALGSELLGGPQTIQASFAGTGAGSSGGVVNFDPKQYEERAGLLEINGQIVTVWTSHCDIDPYTGWIIAYDAGTLTRSSVLNVTPNGSRGGMWMAGAGPAADAQGNVYVLDGNGTFDTTLTGAGFPNKGDFGNAFLKIATAGGLSVADYFATFDTVSASQRRYRPRIRRGHGLSGLRRRVGGDAPPRRRRRQGRPPVRRRPRRDGEMERVVQPELPGHQRRARRVGVLDAGLFQQHSVLRRVGGEAESVRDRQRQGVGDRRVVERRVIHLSGHDAVHFGVRIDQRHRVGGREQESGGAPRI